MFVKQFILGLVTAGSLLLGGIAVAQSQEPVETRCGEQTRCIEFSAEEQQKLESQRRLRLKLKMVRQSRRPSHARLSIRRSKHGVKTSCDTNLSVANVGSLREHYSNISTVQLLPERPTFGGSEEADRVETVRPSTSVSIPLKVGEHATVRPYYHHSGDMGVIVDVFKRGDDVTPFEVGEEIADVDVVGECVRAMRVNLIFQRHQRHVNKRELLEKLKDRSVEVTP